MVEIILSPLAVKKYKKIGAKDRPKVDKKINLLSQQPLLGKALEGQYKGKYSLYAWPIRIIYIFDSVEQIIQIINIDYRGNIYKN